MPTFRVVDFTHFFPYFHAIGDLNVPNLQPKWGGHFEALFPFRGLRYTPVAFESILYISEAVFWNLKETKLPFLWATNIAESTQRKDT
jgi:hypothetical protein